MSRPLTFRLMWLKSTETRTFDGVQPSKLWKRERIAMSENDYPQRPEGTGATPRVEVEPTPQQADAPKD